MATPRGQEGNTGALGALRAQLILSVLLPALLLGAIAWHEHDQVIASTDRQVEKTAEALGEHALKVLETDDLIMARVLDHVRGLGWDEIGSSRSVHDFLVEVATPLPQIDSLFLVDPDGRIVASTRAFPVQRFEVDQRGYFLAAKRSPGDTFISAPFRGQIGGGVAFSLSRARLRDGNFDGLVGITISSAYFDSFYRAVSDAHDGATASLIRQDGTLLMHYPMPTDGSAPPRPDAKLASAIAEGDQTGLLEATSEFDGRTRLLAFQHLHGRPIVVSYGVDKQGALEDWRTHLDIYAALAGAMSLILVVTTYGALRRVQGERHSAEKLDAETVRRERAEDALRQSQKIEALGRLTGGVAHDFNNLLTVISGNLELIEMRADLNDATRRRLASIRKAAENGGALVRRMLAFSRRQPLQAKLVELADWMEDVRNLLEHSLRPDIAIETAMPADLWPVRVDPGQLESSLLNLAVNARDAMPGAGTLTLRARNVTLPAPEEPSLKGDFVEIAVADNGTGMTEDTRRQAIEPFFTTKPVDHGTGLGLSQVYGFVKQSGGSVALDSAPGLGTTVYLYLPRAVLEVQESRDAVLARTVHFEPGSLLLVEDDEDVAKVAAGLLERLGCTVTTAPNAAIALERLESGEEFSLMVSDIMMPGTMNGLDLARLTRRRWPELRILLATGYSAAADEAVAEGFPIISKPLSLRVLTQMFQSRLVRSG
ncbi:MAG TPA: cache domain-containing protein [Aliidongia sp.]|nr:cache domain-containing protein [Aliidongia sp.]